VGNPKLLASVSFDAVRWQQKDRESERRSEKLTLKLGLILKATEVGSIGIIFRHSKKDRRVHDELLHGQVRSTKGALPCVALLGETELGEQNFLFSFGPLFLARARRRQCRRPIGPSL